MYQEMIREGLAKMGFIGKYNPRHIEGYMRLEHSTLDGLSDQQFNNEIKISAECIDAGVVAAAEELAVSFGL